MLYPLSYEGLRPIWYLAAETGYCPGAASGAARSQTLPCGRSRRW